MTNINLLVAEILDEGIMAPPGQKGLLGKTASVVGGVANTALNPVTATSNAMQVAGQLPIIKQTGQVAHAVLNPISTVKAGASKAGSFLSRF